jgi:hypothetical protein
MSKDELELQTLLLRMMHAAGDIGITADLLLSRARVESWRELTLPQLETTLRSMADQGLAIAVERPLSAQRWRATGIGKSALQEMGLA